MRNELSQAFGTLAEGFFLCSSWRAAYYGSLCSCAWPQRARKRQLMPIRIEQMEIPFAPRSILRLFGLESQLLKRLQIASTSATWKMSRPQPSTGLPCSKLRMADSASPARSDEKNAPSPP